MDNMRYLVLFVTLLFFCSEGVQAQKRRQKKWQKNQVGCVPQSDYSLKKSSGLGIRVGEPYGITYKNYIGKHFAVEVVAGSSAGGLNSNYIRDEFRNTPENVDNQYLTHESNYILAGQARAMFQTQLDEQYGGLEWYAGLGVQYRYLNIEYTFRQPDPDGPTPDSFDIVQNDQQFDSWGPEYFAGFEYPFLGESLTLFAEATLFSDDIQKLWEVRFMGGIGLRYHFR